MPLNNFLHASCFNIPGALQQLPACIWFYIWFPCGLLKSHPPVRLSNFPHSCGSISKLSPPVSPQRLAWTVIWVQYLDFRFSSQQLPASLSLTNFLRSSGLNIYMFPRFSRHLLACILSQYRNPPTLCLSAASGIHFCVPKLPLPLSDFFACIFMYLHLVSMSRLHPSSLNNFLHSSCFNIEFSLPPMCLSISCIHFASYVNFPWPLHHFLRFVVSIFEPPLHQQLLACILHQYLNSSHPVPGPKKIVQVQ